MLARCRAAFLLALVSVPLLITGCRSSRSDLVERDNRRLSNDYLDARQQLEMSEARNHALQMENDAIRRGMPILPEQAAAFGIKRIAFGRGTGALDNDNAPGDELLQVVIEPRDIEDHTIKAPGTLQIYTLEITPQGLKVPLTMWEIPPDKLRASWKQGLFSTGYTLTLPWKTLPIVENVRVVARFVTPDLRVYEAEKDIKVHLVPGALEKRPVLLPAPPTCPVPSDAPPLLVPTAGRVTSSVSKSAPPESQWHAVTPADLAAPSGGAANNDVVTLGRPEAVDSRR